MFWPFKPKTKTRSDGFVNMASGMGVPGVDKTLGSQYVPRGLLSTQELESVYGDNDLASLAVDILPDEALRRGFGVLTGDAEEDKDLGQWMRNSKILEKVNEASIWGRLYGSGAVVLGTTDGNLPEEPLDLESITSLDWLLVLEREEYQVNSYKPDGSPKTLTITPNTLGGSPSMVVDASRLVFFGGAKTTKRRKNELSSFDQSVLQRVYEIIEDFEAAYNNIGTLLADGNTGIFKMSGLANALAGETDGSNAVQKRFQMMQFAKSVHRALVLDAGDGVGEPAEDFTREVAQFSGLGELVDKFVLRLSSALRIPAMVLVGSAPSGLNAVGDSELRLFYDRVSTYRILEIEPQILQILETLRASSEWNARGDRLEVTWPELWTPSELEQAQARQAQATTDSTYITSGVLTPEEVTISRFGGDSYSYETTISPEGLAAREETLEADYSNPEAAIATTPDEV